MRKLYPYLKGSFGIFVFSIVIKALGAVTDIAIPSFMGRVIDEGIVRKDINQIIFLCVMMLIFTVMTVAFNLSANKISSKATQRMGENLRNSLYGHIQNLTVQDVDNWTPATLVTRASNDVERVQQAMLMMCRVAIRAPVMGIGGLVLSFFIDPKLTAVIFVGMLLVGVVSLCTYKMTRPIFRRVQKSIDTMTVVLRESISGIKVIKSFNKGAHETKRFDVESKKVRDSETSAGKINTVSGPTISLIVGITIAAVLFYAVFRIRDSAVEIGQVVTIINYTNQILVAMSTMPRIFMMMSRAYISANRINEIMDTTETTKYGDRERGIENNEILSVENVSFKYQEGGGHTLHNVSFSIKRGQTVGVIGGTGAGKSTLLSLLLRLYEPQKGRIMLKGYPISEYSSEYLHKSITAALQQYNIFAMTMRENITLDLAENKEDELEAAAETAQLKNVVDRMDGRFDYEIAQTGGNLSGGQKQRVNIARTLFRNAELTILDDVSSALDYKTDLKLRTALKDYKSGNSFLLISQRVSSVREADRILVLKDGRVKGFDTHERLIRNCEAYREICKTQGIDLDDEIAGGEREDYAG